MLDTRISHCFRTRILSLTPELRLLGIFLFFFAVLLVSAIPLEQTIAGMIMLAFTYAFLLSAVFTLFMAVTMVTRACWIVLLRPIPWSVFRRLGVLVPLALLFYLWAQDPHSDGPCLCEIIGTMWRSLSAVDKILFVWTPVLLELNQWIQDLKEYDRETTSKAIISCKEGPLHCTCIDEIKRDLEAMDCDASSEESCSEEHQASLQEAEDCWADAREHLQCSICWGFLRQPYVTSCGHVFDLGCLLRWFTDAPPFEGIDLDLDPAHRDYFWTRSKICPFCRAVLRIPPIPLFFLEGLLDLVGDDDAASDPPVRLNLRPGFWYDVFAREIYPPPRELASAAVDRIARDMFGLPPDPGPLEPEQVDRIRDMLALLEPLLVQNLQGPQRPLLREQPQAEPHLDGPRLQPELQLHPAPVEPLEPQRQLNAEHQVPQLREQPQAEPHLGEPQLQPPPPIHLALPEPRWLAPQQVPPRPLLLPRDQPQAEIHVHEPDPQPERPLLL